MAEAQNTLSFFCNRTKSHPEKKMKECFRQRFVPLRSRLLKKIVNKLFNILHHKQNLILSLRQLKAGATRYKLHSNYETY
jgi:hypothetical protein